MRSDCWFKTFDDIPLLRDVLDGMFCVGRGVAVINNDVDIGALFDSFIAVFVPDMLDSLR